MDDFIDFCQHRRSIRNFTSEMPDRQDIIEIIIAGSFAPSIGDLQPWQMVLITEPETISSLASVCVGNEWLQNAPVVIAVVCDYERIQTYHGDSGRVGARDSCCAAMQNMLLAANQKQLGACWVSQFDEEVVSEKLSCSQDHVVVGLIAVGVAEDPLTQEKDITNLGEFVYFNSYGNTQIDAETRLRDYGETARKKAKKIRDAASRKVSTLDKFKDQLSSWVDQTKRK